jgi:hypothetical protein
VGVSKQKNGGLTIWSALLFSGPRTALMVAGMSAYRVMRKLDVTFAEQRCLRHRNGSLRRNDPRAGHFAQYFAVGSGDHSVGEIGMLVKNEQGVQHHGTSILWKQDIQRMHRKGPRDSNPLSLDLFNPAFLLPNRGQH